MTENKVKNDRPVAVFDSGVGGISTLGAMRKILPEEHFIYYGDTANAPYGVKSQEEVLACVKRVVAQLMESDPKALVIACNTATSVAAATLRAEMTIPVIGIEPALKPASLSRHGGQVMVLATPVTLKLPKFLTLMEKYGEGAVPVPCPGLMDLVEARDLNGAEAYLSRLCETWRKECVDAVVLGCTHYVFLRDIMKQLVGPETLVLDGNEGTARQLDRVLKQKDLRRKAGEGSVTFMTSGDPETVLPEMTWWLEQAMKLA